MPSTTSIPPRPLDAFAPFLPPPAKLAIFKAADLLEATHIPVDDLLSHLLLAGESILHAGLSQTVETLETLVATLYDTGLIAQLGSLNSFLRDGFEIGLQLLLNTLKALTPADVAKILGLTLIALTAPNMILLGAPDYLDMITTLALKLWNLP